MWFGLISLFPELYKPFSELGVFGRSVESNLIALDIVNPRDFATDRHRTVDDRPYGGGPGMLMKVQPLKDALSAAKQLASKQGVEASRVVYLSPQGNRFDDEAARSLAQEQGLILIAGRYEGVDERFIQDSVDMELSIGDFVLSGGELASMVVMDAVARHIDGVLGHSESAERDSFAEGLLDCPHYTRPEVLNGRSVPEVLLSGDHERIRKWRLQQALARTYERRPDLLERKELSQEQRLLLDEYLKDVNR